MPFRLHRGDEDKARARLLPIARVGLAAWIAGALVLGGVVGCADVHDRQPAAADTATPTPTPTQTPNMTVEQAVELRMSQDNVMLTSGYHNNRIYHSETYFILEQSYFPAESSRSYTEIFTTILANGTLEDGSPFVDDAGVPWTAASLFDRVRFWIDLFLSNKEMDDTFEGGYGIGFDFVDYVVTLHFKEQKGSAEPVVCSSVRVKLTEWDMFNLRVLLYDALRVVYQKNVSACPYFDPVTGEQVPQEKFAYQLP